MNLLTSSRMRSFRTCARLHHFRYVEGWSPIRDSEALRFGSLFHVGLEGWWNAIRDGSDPLEAAYLAVYGRGFDAFEQVKVEELLRGYDAAWRAEAAAYEVLGVELKFEAPLLNPGTWKESRTWRLAGKMDLLLRRRADQRTLVCEHKTSTENIEEPGASYWAKLSMDHQISAYVLGAEALGHQVHEILYDVAFRPQQRPLKATPLEARKFTKDGRLYATQREADETPEEYRARVREAIAEAPRKFYQRQSIPRTEGQIRDFLADAWQQAISMREGERLGFAPRNPDACHRFGTCSYWDACSTSLSPESFPDLYQRVKDVNPELMEV